jgi:ATP-dependent helicase/nuclease subunit B
MSELNLTKLYFGLQLQLIIYLAAALERGACRPAGAFYFKVADPVISTEERDAGKVDLLRTDELRLSGLFIDDREVLDAMSPDIEHTVPLSLKTAGTVRASARMVDEEGFRLLIGHALSAAARIAEGIQQGRTEIAPVRMSGFCSCDRCDWRALCQQDPRLGGMPRTLPSLQQTDVLRQIRAEREAEE